MPRLAPQERLIMPSWRWIASMCEQNKQTKQRRGFSCAIRWSRTKHPGHRSLSRCERSSWPADLTGDRDRHLQNAGHGLQLWADASLVLCLGLCLQLSHSVCSFLHLPHGILACTPLHIEPRLIMSVSLLLW